MKFADFVCFEAIIPELQAKDRDSAIAELVSSLDKANQFTKGKSQEIARAAIERENEASTGIGKGVAVPHVKHKAVADVVAAVGCKSEGLEFASLDKQPVYSVVLLISPDKDADRHLQAMESIFKCLQKDDFRKFLRQAQSVEQIRDVIEELHPEIKDLL